MADEQAADANPPDDQGGGGNAGGSNAGGGGGGGRRGYRGRNNNRRGNNNNNNQRNQAGSTQRFEGREATLKGHVYDLSNERNSEQFTKTTKEVMNWVGREYTKYTGEFVEAVNNLNLEAPAAVPNPPANDVVAFEVWKINRKKFEDHEEAQNNFRARLFAIVLGQCTEALEDRLKSHSDWLNAQQNGIALLQLIKTITYTFEERRYLPEALLDVKEEFYRLSQGRHEPLQRYYERFKNQVSVMEEVGITIADDGLVNSIAIANGNLDGNGLPLPNDNDRLEASNKTLAARFIRGANKKCAPYLAELRNSYLNDIDNYPTNLTRAYNIIQRRSEMSQPLVEPDGHGIAFVTAGRNGRTYDHITCHTCQQVGHYADQCPNRPAEENGEQGIVAFSSVSERKRDVVPRSWILLDNQANVDLFHNRQLLRNIRRVNSSMTVHCNAGTTTTNLKGDLPGYPKSVWYCPKAIANILSLSNVKNIPRWRVNYSSEGGDEFVVTKDDGSTVVFGGTNGGTDDGRSPVGLYVYDAKKAGLEGVVLVDTVAENKTKYTLDEINRAEIARSLQIKIGRPTTRDFVRYVTQNQLPNCPVTKVDILNAEDIFGTDVGSLKGKTTRSAPHRVRLQQHTMLPPQVMERHKQVTICADILFINGIPFLASISRDIKFGTIEEIQGRSTKQIMKAFNHVLATYRGGGFRVRHSLMDGEFAPLMADLAERGVRLNTTARDEHVGEIERFIRTIKERVRCIFNTLPFTRIPPRVVIEMAKHAVFWRNAFPATNGVSDSLSPRTVVTNTTIDHNRHCRFEFGEYVQTHEEHDNSMQTRTVGALALRPTGNAQGSYYFFSLSTGRVINRSNGTKLPMPNEVIDRVHLLARRQKANRGLVFGDRTGEAIDDQPDDMDYDDDDDSTYAPPDGDNYDDVEYDSDYSDVGADGADDDVADDEDDDASSSSSSSSSDNSGDSSYHPDGDDDDESIGSDNRNDAGPETDVAIEGNTGVDSSDEGSTGVDNDAGPADANGADDDSHDNEGNTGVPTDNDSEENKGCTGVPDAGQDTDVEAEMDAKYGKRSGQHDLRPRRRPTHKDDRHNMALNTVATATKTYKEALLLGSGADANSDMYATPQMTMKQGLKVFGASGTRAVKKEFQQLHDRKVMKPREHKQLTREQKKEALGYLMFLKRKRSGVVKGRGCADGRKQRANTKKEDAASPTVSTEAVFLTAVVDAHEGREVAVVDVPGAFMQIDMDELVFVKFVGVMVDMLLEIDYDMYGQYVTYERGEKVMYVELLKALYGTLRAARLFWERLSAQLVSWGFTPNPYDSCVMNKMVNGKQITVAWHVDDLKISHVETKVVDKFIEDMEDVFGKEAPLSKSRGKVHDYLGMTLDFSKPGELKVTMIDYIKTMLVDMPEDMKGSARTPAASHLFTVNDKDPVLLTGERAETFHRIVMQLQYLSQRARPDLRTAVSFLCKRVTKSDEDDYKKLTRAMKYLQATIDLPLVLKADGTGNMYWWVDASFAVHYDMKGHTGATFSMGKGSIYSTSLAQKLVGRSSTEDELIGVHDVMPQMLWTVYFMEAQGYPVNDTILYQDNKSAMLLEKNGRGSSSKRTRHIKLRFYFIKEHVDSGTVKIEHCPTEVMWGDYFTKPTQGSLYFCQRDVIMNIDPSSQYHSSAIMNSGNRSVLEEPGVGRAFGRACEPTKVTTLLE